MISEKFAAATERLQDYSLFTFTFYLDLGESKLGRLVDALAPGGDEGRDKLR